MSKFNVRARPVRSKAIGRGIKSDLWEGAELYPDVPDVERPRTRSDCAPGGPNEQRPCPFVSCKYNLYLDVKNARAGVITLNFPDLEVDQMPVDGSCALDVADRGGITLEEVRVFMNVTRERVRQIETDITFRLKRLPIVKTLGNELGRSSSHVCAPEYENENEDERVVHDTIPAPPPTLTGEELEKASNPPPPFEEQNNDDSQVPSLLAP